MTAETHPLALVHGNRSLQTKPPMSEQGFSNALALLKGSMQITEVTPLIPLPALENFIEAIESEPATTPPSEAAILADTLIGQNPTYSPHDPKIYYNSLVAIFTAYPRSLGRKAVHKVNGLVANLQFQIKPSDLKSFLDKHKAEEDGALVNAYKMKAEHKRRAKAEDDPVERERRMLTPEQRAERAQMILRGVKPPSLTEF
jgi:hypothetical protein